MNLAQRPVDAPPGAGEPLRLRLVLAPGAPRQWVLDCIGAWRAMAGIRLSVWQARRESGRSGGPSSAAWQPWGIAALRPAAAQGWDDDTSLQPLDRPDLVLVLDRQALACLPRDGDGLPCWVLADDQNRPLDADWPLIDDITRGRGIGVRLLETRVEALRRQKPHDSAGLPTERVREGRWSAGTAYGDAMRQLAPAVTELVLQAARARRLSTEAAADGPTARAMCTLGPGMPVPRVWAARVVGRWRAWRSLQRQRWTSEHWRVGLVDAPVMDWIASGGRLPVRWITPASREGYWADPMGMVGDPGQLFCEYFDEASGRGHLEALQLGADGQATARRRLAVGEGGHASFPLVFELDGRRLGVAETVAIGACELYEVSDTGAWKPLCTLLSHKAAADPALFAWQGRYWLAFTDLALGEVDNLCLYHADRLEGPWLPHANNPVKRDATGARMAGGFFWHEGELYRPAQDCLAAYGSAVMLHRVLKCSPHEYAEEPVARIAPDPSGPCPDGLHTLSAWGDRTLIDGKRMGVNPVVLRRKLLQRLPWRAVQRPARVQADGAGPAPGIRHVAVYIPHLRLGGGETSLLRLASGFARAGLQTDLVVNTMATAELAVPEGLHLVDLGSTGTAAAVRRLASVLRERRPDILLSGFPHTNVAAVMATWLAGAPCRCVLSEHAPLSHQIRQQGGWRYRLLPPMLRWAYRRAAAVVGVSAGVRDDLARLLGDELPMHVIANPVLPDAATAAPAGDALHPWLADPGLRVVLSVSRLSVEKDVPTLIEAFAQLHARHPRLRLLLAGDGPERPALQALLAQRGLSSVVQLVGRIAQPMAWMRRAAVFALASRFEGFGNVLVEALASGVPVVSTDCPVGPREILENGRFGRLVPVGDVAAMADAIEQALSHPAPPPGAKEYAAQFTESRSAASYMALFNRLARGGAAC